MQAPKRAEPAQLPAIERLQFAHGLIASVTSEQEGFVPSAAHRPSRERALGALAGTS